MVNRIYPAELQLNKANSNDSTSLDVIINYMLDGIPYLSICNFIVIVLCVMGWWPKSQ